MERVSVPAVDASAVTSSVRHMGLKVGAPVSVEFDNPPLANRDRATRLICPVDGFCSQIVRLEPSSDVAGRCLVDHPSHPRGGEMRDPAHLVDPVPCCLQSRCPHIEP